MTGSDDATPESRLNARGEAEHRERAFAKWSDIDTTTGCLPAASPRHAAPLDRSEKVLLAILSLHLTILPWAFGTVGPVAQVLSAVLGLVGFITLFIPRAAHSVDCPVVPASVLRRRPVFWIGAALLAWMTLQATNPAWEVDPAGAFVPTEHIRWLPRSVSAPYAESPWRSLLVHTTAFVTLCSLAVGITRRRSAVTLLTVIALNGLFLGIFGVVQRLRDDGHMVFFWPKPNDGFFGTFIYKNHAGAYLVLCLGAAVSLAAWHHVRSADRLVRSSPAPVFAIVALLITASTILSWARAATIAAVVLCAIGLFIGLRAALRNPRLAMAGAAVSALVCIVAAFAYSSVSRPFKIEETIEHLATGITDRDGARSIRRELTAASWDMLKDHWIGGVGAGGFRHVFPRYLSAHPHIEARVGKPVRWEHAHNEWIEVPIEGGAIGSLLLACGLGLALGTFVRARVCLNPVCVPIAGACLLLMGLAWFDYVFRSPAVLVTWISLWSVCTKLTTPMGEASGPH